MMGDMKDMAKGTGMNGKEMPMQMPKGHAREMANHMAGLAGKKKASKGKRSRGRGR